MPEGQVLRQTLMSVFGLFALPPEVFACAQRSETQHSRVLLGELGELAHHVARGFDGGLELEALGLVLDEDVVGRG